MIVLIFSLCAFVVAGLIVSYLMSNNGMEGGGDSVMGQDNDAGDSGKFDIAHLNRRLHDIQKAPSILGVAIGYIETAVKMIALEGLLRRKKRLVRESTDVNKEIKENLLSEADNDTIDEDIKAMMSRKAFENAKYDQIGKGAEGPVIDVDPIAFDKHDKLKRDLEDKRKTNNIYTEHKIKSKIEAAEVIDQEINEAIAKGVKRILGAQKVTEASPEKLKELEEFIEEIEDLRRSRKARL